MTLNNLIDISGKVVRYITFATMIAFVVPILILFLFARQIGFTEETYNPILALLASIVVGLPTIFAFLIANNSALYYSILAVVILFSLLSLFNTNHITVNKTLAVIILIAITVFMFIPYQTAVQPAEGYSITSPTRPRFLGHSLRNLQVLGEVTPCSYQLLGWKEQNLFYEEICSAKSSMYQFNPQTEQTIRVNDIAAIENVYISPTAHTEILAQFQTKGIKPYEAELATIELSVRGTALLSPNNEWLATLARHVYGPEDILVVTQRNY